MNATYTMDQLVAVGGKVWRDRVYFNDLEALAGLECSEYGTGRISSASVDGKTVSNTHATDLRDVLRTGKVWFEGGAFHWRIQNGRNIDGVELGRKIVTAIKAKLA